MKTNVRIIKRGLISVFVLLIAGCCAQYGYGQKQSDRQKKQRTKQTSNTVPDNQAGQEIVRNYPATIYIWHKAKAIGNKIPIYINDKAVEAVAPNQKLIYKQHTMGQLKVTVKNTEVLSGKNPDIKKDRRGTSQQDMDYYLNVAPNSSYYLCVSPCKGHNFCIEEMDAKQGQKEFDSHKTKFLNTKEEEYTGPVITQTVVQPKVSPKVSTPPEEEPVKPVKDMSSVRTVENVSDIDKDIPVVGEPNSHRYALVFGNEDYSSYQEGLGTESNVDFARQDARTFAKYCENVLGVPKENIYLLCDATSSKMKQKIDLIVRVIQYSKGEAEVYFYFAGHGYPDIETHEPFIMPVDVSGNNPREGIKLADLYQKLSSYPAKRVTVFLDACFSGGGRNKGLLVARAVKVRPNTDTPSGNLVVFSSTSGEALSLPYKEKYHGIFTYYLLKKIKETRGNVSYSDLWKYLLDEVPLQSVKVNEAVQIPAMNVSPELNDKWGNMKIK